MSHVQYGNTLSHGLPGNVLQWKLHMVQHISLCRQGDENTKPLHSVYTGCL